MMVIYGHDEFCHVISLRIQAEFCAKGVYRLYATGSAFAALKKDGRVVAWGNAAAGGRTADESSL